MQSLIHHALEASAARFPGKAALVMDGVPTTYAELNAEANRVARALLKAGIGRRDRVAFLGLNSREFLATHYGACKAGAVFVPLNCLSPLPELRVFLDDARPSALVVGASHAAQAASLSDQVRELALCLLCGGGSGFEGAASYHACLADQPGGNPEIRIDPDDDCLMMYTGGTTGTPKAAVCTHAARVATAIESALAYEVTHDDVGIHASPFFHTGTLCLGLQTKLMMGCTAVCFQRFSADSYLEAIDRYGITYLSGVPTVLQRVLSHPDAARYHYRSLRKALYGASTMPEAVQARALELWPRIGLFQGYGSTECGQASVLRPCDHAGDKRLRTGAPMPRVDLKVVGEDLVEVPSGTVGELLVRSRQLMRCYHGRPGLTAEVLVGGWYRTRDAAWLDDDGYMTIVGRLDDMIVTGGEKVFPREVEDVLLQHPAVADAAVCAVPDADWGQSVCAAVVLRPNAAADAKVLAEFCRTRLAGYKKPKHMRLVREIPRTRVGKPDRNALVRLFRRQNP